MDKEYEEYFDSLAEGEEALSFAEFCEALSETSRKPTVLKAIFSVCALNHSGGEIGAEKQNPRCRDLILPAKPTSRVIA
ncbi:hypothetical protein RAF34_28630 [Klebsiella pneumoniae]